MHLNRQKRFSLILLLQNDQSLDEALLLLQTLQDDFGMVCALMEITNGIPTASQFDFMTRHRAATAKQDRQLICIDMTPWRNQHIEEVLGCKPVPILLRQDNEDDVRKAIVKILRLTR